MKQKLLIRKWVVAISCMCVLVLTVVCCLTIASRADDSKDKPITNGFATNDLVPAENGEKGTASNPVVVLELVPDMKFANIGYLIDGCEPVDIDKILKAAKNGDSTANESLNILASSGIITYTNVNGQMRKFDLEDGDDTNRWQYDQYTFFSQNGYYERVEDGNGLYSQTVVATDESGAITDATYNRVDKNKGEVGNFVWVPSQDDPLPATNHNAVNVGDRVYMTRTGPHYVNYNYNTITYKHNNVFKKKVLELDDSEIADYHIVVKTVTPAELNAHNDWVDRADLVSITNKTYRRTLCDVYRTYSKIPYKDTGRDDNTQIFTNNNDLTWETVMKVFNKIATAEDKAGIVIDQSVYTEILNSNTMRQTYPKQIGLDGKVINSPDNNKNSCKGSNNNVFKLSLMLTTMNPVAFNNLYLRDYGEERGPAIIDGKVGDRTTGVYKVQQGDAQTYWGMYTFMPPKLDGSISGVSDWDPNGECFLAYDTKSQLQYDSKTTPVNSQVYMFPSDMSLLDRLDDLSVIFSKPVNKELFDYIENKTGVEENTTSPAIALQFIMGIVKDKGSKMKESIRVLDLEPCTVSTKLSCPKNYLSEVYLRTRIAPTYTGKVMIDHQSTAEFNGKLDDINSTYDMIYMGLYYGRLNVDTNNKTVYNDSALNGKIYLHVGDKVVSRNSNQYVVDWPSNMNNIARGPGNDITQKKMNELKDYLKSGLPVITDSDLYNLNSTYMDRSAYISQFIVGNKDNVLNVASTTTVSKVTASLRKSGLILHMDDGDCPKQYEGESNDGTISNSEYINRRLVYQFTLEDSEAKSEDTYTAKLYVDSSRDGTYSEEEVVTTTSNLKANGTKYSIIKQLGNNYVGAIPWKFVVYKNNNKAIRDTRIGFSAIKRSIAEKKNIKILQVKDNGVTTMDLEQNVKNRGLFYKYTNNLNDYNITFKTIDIKTFESWYSNNNRFSYNGTDEEKGLADRLGSYNMIIFGFSDAYSNISNQYGALDNLKYYIDSGKSVLFTHDLTSFTNIASGQAANAAGSKGYNFNVMFRDYLGMDRFGIRTTDPVLKAKKDKATTPFGETYSQIQGYTYHALAKLGDNNRNTYPLFTGCKFSADTLETTKASKLNGGQITQYPYLIDDDLKIESTHSQYYQLDLNDDDMIVWYTLNQSDNADNGYFSCSANDAANNYYIYNKGNVTYSGVGHNDISKNDMEVKLFVNTMIAAYSNANEAPTVEVVNPGVFCNAENEYSLYVSVDYAETIFNDTRYEDIAFIPRNNSLIVDTLYVKPLTADGVYLDVYDEAGNLITPNDKQYVKLQDGQIYHLRWPQSYLQDQLKRDINFTCYYVDQKDKNRYGGSKAHLLRRNSFDLD